MGNGCAHVFVSFSEANVGGFSRAPTTRWVRSGVSSSSRFSLCVVSARERLKFEPRAIRQVQHTVVTKHTHTQPAHSDNSLSIRCFQCVYVRVLLYDGDEKNGHGNLRKTRRDSWYLSRLSKCKAHVLNATPLYHVISFCRWWYLGVACSTWTRKSEQAMRLSWSRSTRTLWSRTSIIATNATSSM